MTQPGPLEALALIAAALALAALLAYRLVTWRTRS